jgi:hypothetical protein
VYAGETTCDPAIRDRVIKEIIDTEEDYIRDLEVIINVRINISTIVLVTPL